MNSFILERLVNINKSPTELNKEMCKPRFHLKKKIKFKGLTLEENNKLKEENIKFQNRIRRQNSYFDLDKWKNDYKQAQYYKKNICCFPSIDFRKTYSYFDKQNERFKTNYISNNLKNF